MDKDKLILKEYQKEIATHIINNECTHLWVGVGLGKTASVIASYLYLRKDNPIMLVVAPLRVANVTWHSEVAKWAQFDDVKTYNLRTAEGIEAYTQRKAGIYTINFEKLATRKGSKKLGFYDGLFVSYDNPDILVIDESSMLKNPRSKRAKILEKMSKGCKRVVGLTGTPQPNSELDLIEPAIIMSKGKLFGGSYNKLMKEHFTYNQWKHCYEPRSKDVLDKITRVASQIALVKKTEDYRSIAEHIEEDILISMDKYTKRIYNEMENEFLAEVVDEAVIEAVSAGAKLSKLRQITSGNVYDEDKEVVHIHDDKVDALGKLMKDIGGKSLLILCEFNHEIASILHKFPDVVKFSEDKIDDWNNGKIQYMVANPRSMSHGLNLQGSCHNMVWMSLTYSSETYIQTVARLARTGQTEQVMVYRMMMSGTVDEAIAEVLRDKAEKENISIEVAKKINLLHK